MQFVLLENFVLNTMLHDPLETVMEDFIVLKVNHNPKRQVLYVLLAQGESIKCFSAEYYVISLEKMLVI